ncbi:MAG: hypothetical protein Kow0042_19910 [Calditrichia bacterium]
MSGIKHWLLILIISFFGLLIGCKKDQSPEVMFTTNQEEDQDISGRYSYSGFNLDSVMVVFGTLEINLQDSLITGRKDIQRVDTVQINNYEEGTGEIEGRIIPSGEILIYLTPVTKVPTLQILGTINEGIYTGIRQLDTGVPPVARQVGSFIAEKIDKNQ